MITLQHTNRVGFNRQRVTIEFPVRVRIVSRTPKAILAIPMRKHRHGVFVPRLWVPRSIIPEAIHVDVDIVTMTIPLWIWEKNARPDPGLHKEARCYSNPDLGS